MSVHAYPISALVGDYLRAAAGFVPSAAVLLTMPVGAVGGIVLGGLAALFGAFGLSTLLRHLTRIERTEEGLVAGGPWRRAIRWDALDRMKLAYYATARDRKNGWLQLDLRAGAARLRVDSRIDGFSELVARAADAASSRGLHLSEATLTNLEALGLGVAAGPRSAPMRAAT
jgi:hypothetical protein